MDNVKFSIITVCRNAEHEITKTIESVYSQTYGDYEYIIIDGKSDDGTLDTIKSYINDEKKLTNKTRLISEKDSGVYNAMNKGIDLARGEWIIFLNAGDYLFDDFVLEKIYSNIDDNCQIIYGDTVYVEQFGEYIVGGKNISEITKGMPFCHQSSLIKSELARKLHFDEKFLVCADYDMFSRAYIDGSIFKYINMNISYYIIGGMSDKNRIRMVKENHFIGTSHGFSDESKISLWMKIFRAMVGKFVVELLPKKFVKYLKNKIRIRNNTMNN